jgi:hypothetical protein
MVRFNRRGKQQEGMFVVRNGSRMLSSLINILGGNANGSRTLDVVKGDGILTFISLDIFW